MTSEGTVALAALGGLVVGVAGLMLVAFAATYKRNHEAGYEERKRYTVPAMVFFFIAVVSALVLVCAGIVATVRAIT